jgi:hypothetical protein
MNRRLAWSIGLLTAGLLLATAALPPLPQPPEYHLFADRRSFLGIPAFLNVVSNLPLLLFGALGLGFLLRRGRPAFVAPREIWPYALFFLGILLTGCGSAWYHLAPDNERLFWDRLPLAAVCAAFTATVVSDRLGSRAGLIALLCLLAAGLGSVFYWIATERAGAGDLRPYGFVHFYPAVLVPVLLRCAPARYSRGGEEWGVLFFFGLSLACELLDRPIFALGGLVSGHTLKHLFAAVAVWWVLRMLAARRPLLV